MNQEKRLASQIISIFYECQGNMGMVFERRLLKCKSSCIDRLVGELSGSFEMQNSEELHVLLFHLLYLAHFRRDMVMRRILRHYHTIMDMTVDVDPELFADSSEDAERANHSNVANSLLNILQELIKYNTIIYYSKFTKKVDLGSESDIVNNKQTYSLLIQHGMTVLRRLISHFKYISEITENGVESLKRPKRVVANHYSSWCFPWLLGMHAELRTSLYKPTVILAHCFTAATQEYQQGLCECVPGYLSSIDSVKKSYERHVINERFMWKYCNHLGIRSKWPSEETLKKTNSAQIKHSRAKNDSGAISLIKQASPFKTIMKKFTNDKSNKSEKERPQLTLKNLAEQVDDEPGQTIAPADDYGHQKTSSCEANGDLRIPVQPQSNYQVPIGADRKSRVEVGLNVEGTAGNVEGPYDEPSMDEPTESDYDEFPVVENS